MARQGWAGEVWQGKARHGVARFGRQGKARHGVARDGGAGEAGKELHNNQSGEKPWCTNSNPKCISQ